MPRINRANPAAGNRWFYAFLIAALPYPPFPTAIRNFFVVYFQRFRPIFNFVHLRLELSDFMHFAGGGRRGGFYPAIRACSHDWHDLY